MMCTKCKAPIRPVVAVDIDGTIGQYHQHFLRFAEAYYGRTFKPYFGEGTLAQHMGISKVEYRTCKLAYRQGGMKRSMPVYPGAAELVRGLQDEGMELWFTTTRPYLRLDNTDPDTREWLARNDLHYDHLLYNENKYEVLAGMVDPARIVAVLDDEIEHYQAAARAGISPILMVRNHNQRDLPAALFNAVSLEEAYKMILVRLDTWKESYAH